MSFSTFELPIRKLIKMVIILGGIGFTLGITTFVVIAGQAGVFKPDATAILGNAAWTFHVSFPGLFIFYALFGSGATTIFWLDRRHQKSERVKRYKERELMLKPEVNI